MKNQNWKSLALISLIVVGFIAYVFWNKTNNGEPSVFSIEPTPTMSSNAKTPLYTPPPQPTAIQELTPATAESPNAEPTAKPTVQPVSTPGKDAGLNPMQKSVVQSMPKISAIRDEVQKNPHEAPGSGVQFAMMLGEREKIAIENEQDSKNLMTELEACGLTKEPDLKYPSVQMICLTTARDLAEKWPSLKPRYKLLMKNADPTAVGLANETLKESM